jgi:hypothetical protein
VDPEEKKIFKINKEFSFRETGRICWKAAGTSWNTDALEVILHHSRICTIFLSMFGDERALSQ